MSAIPSSWMPAAKMDRVICHWTAGRHKASATDKKHYHVLIEGDGTVVKGDPSIKLNEAPAKDGYAAHTRNCNSGSIGVSMCCMWNAKESPFDAGPAPMTKVQWTKMVQCVAELCVRYKIPVTPKTVLSHAEVQANLGIAQRGKWDFTRLAFDISTAGAKACGDKLRRDVSAAIAGATAPAPAAPAKPAEPATTHKVVNGDTWFGIARNYGLEQDDLLAFNSAKATDTLKIGRVLQLVPAKPAPEPKPAPAPAPVAAPQEPAKAIPAPTQPAPIPAALAPAKSLWQRFLDLFR